MATLAGLTTDTLNMIYGIAQVERPIEDTIDAGFNAAVTTMPVTTDVLWKKDDLAEFADGELVIAVSDGTGTTFRRQIFFHLATPRLQILLGNMPPRFNHNYS